MEGTLDIQRDHVTLIQQAMKLLNAGGILVFSNNLRKFKLDEATLQETLQAGQGGVKIENITQKPCQETLNATPKFIKRGC